MPAPLAQRCLPAWVPNMPITAFRPRNTNIAIGMRASQNWHNSFLISRLRRLVVGNNYLIILFFRTSES